MFKSGTVNFEMEKMQDVQVVGLLIMHELNLIHQIMEFIRNEKVAKFLKPNY